MMAEDGDLPTPDRIERYASMAAVENQFGEFTELVVMEGGVVYSGGGPGRWALVTDEGTLAGLLDEDEDRDLRAGLVGVYRFRSRRARDNYAAARGWREPPDAVSEAIDEACDRTLPWYRSLAAFETRPFRGSVMGFRTPYLLSEHDCVMHFARHLHDSRIAWEDMHLELSKSQWIFDEGHPADAGLDWRADLAIIRPDAFLSAALPSPKSGGFQFDAFVEVAYIHVQSRKQADEKLRGDMEKLERYAAANVTSIRAAERLGCTTTATPNCWARWSPSWL
jgi:hypothetical protein